MYCQYNSLINRIAAFALGAAFALSPSLGRTENLLTERECSFVREYDVVNRFSFASDFSYMAHFVDAGPDCFACFRPLTKRHLDLRITLHGLGTLQGSESVAAALALYVTLMTEETDLSATYQLLQADEFADGGVIAVFFLNRANIQDAIDLFEGRPRFQAELAHFIRPDNTCYASNPMWNTSSEASMVFVNTEYDNSPEFVFSCVMQELYNATGLRGDPQGDIGLFSNLRWQGPRYSAPMYFDYGLRDRIMMRMLFDEVFTNGQDHEETLSEAQSIIEQCYREDRGTPKSPQIP